MNSETLTALKKSIAKWRKNEKARRAEDLKLGIHNCPLCVLFWEDGCRGCPVRERTGKHGCGETPYDFFNGYHEDNSEIAVIRIIARSERQFLESLLPPKSK